MSRFYLNNIWFCIVLFALVQVEGDENEPEDLPSEFDCTDLGKTDCRSLHTTNIGSCKWLEHSQKCTFIAPDTQTMQEHNSGNGLSTGTDVGQLYQSDIVVTDDNQDLVLGTDSSTDSNGPSDTQRRSLKNGVQLFPDQTVTWYFDNSYSGSKDAARDAMAELNEDTGGCLKFKEVASTYSGPAVRIHDSNSGSCHVDWLGAPFNRSGKRVNMNLGWCGKEQYIGSIQHEFIHALGFYHEQSRTDRDDYITVHWDKIDDSWKSQWYKQTGTATQNLEYDYTSIMHYPPSKGQFTTKDRRFQNLVGQRTYISDLDIRGLQLLYKCEVTVFSGNIRLGGSNTAWCMYDKEDSGEVTMRECNKKYDGDNIKAGLNHHWTYNKVTGQIRAMFGSSRNGVGKCLKANGTTAGSGVSLINCNESDTAQQWALGDGKLMNKNSKLCVTASKLEKDAGLTVQSCAQNSALDDFEIKEYTKFNNVTGFAPTKKPTSSGKYKFAQTGTNSCDGVGKVLTTVDECKVATKDLGLTFQQTLSSPSYPKGCWKYGSSYVYFSAHSTGGTNSNSAPICRACDNCTAKPTSPTAKPTPGPTNFNSPAPTTNNKYVSVGQNKADCGSYVKISNEADCKKAAAFINQSYTSSFSSGNYPSGCMLYGTKVYFNRATTGKAQSNSSPLCCNGCTAAPTSIVTAQPTNFNSPAPTTNNKYVSVGNNKADCGSYMKISNEADCKKATAFINKSYANAFSSSNYPSGCMLYGTKVYFNRATTGKAQSSSSPLCCNGCASAAPTTAQPTTRVTAQPTSAAGLFFTVAKSNTCPSNSKYISSEGQCKAAASHLKLQYKSSNNYCTYPKGCFKYYGRAYHNRNYKGKINSGSFVRLICKSTASSTKAPSSSSTKADCPKLSTIEGRCGTNYGRCNKNLVEYAIYCNESNGWCGTSDQHRDAQQSDVYDWQPRTCAIASSTKAPSSKAPTSSAPTAKQTTRPTSAPVVEPTSAPVVEPTSAPVVEPTTAPVVEPTSAPVVEPTSAPVVEPTSAPVVEPTSAPVVEPTSAPVVEPTASPTAAFTKDEGTQSTGYITKLNVNDCPTGSSAVEHRSGCFAAAKAISVEFIGGVIQSDYPKGCFIYNKDYVFFNGHQGSNESNSAVICSENTDSWRRAEMGLDLEPIMESQHHDEVEALMMKMQSNRN